MPSGTSLGIMPADLLGLEHRAGGEVHERELRLGAAKARHAGAGLGALPVPQDAVARRVGHRAAAAELVEQAAGSGALAEAEGRLLVLEELDAGATGLREGLEERLRAMQFVEGDVSGRDRTPGRRGSG